MKLTLLIITLLGFSSFSFAQTAEPKSAPSTTTAPVGVPSDINPLKEIKPGKKHVKSTHLQASKAKAKHKTKKKKQH